jgi:hypothetical protein
VSQASDEKFVKLEITKKIGPFWKNEGMKK